HTRFSRDWSSDVCSSDLRELVTISDTPIMRPDGTILFERGYDAATKTILEPSVTIKVPDSPTMEDAFQARDRLMALLVDFPLVRSEERRVGKECRCRLSP